MKNDAGCCEKAVDIGSEMLPSQSKHGNGATPVADPGSGPCQPQQTQSNRVLFVLDGANLTFSFGEALYAGLGMDRTENGRPPLSSTGLLLAMQQFEHWVAPKESEVPVANHSTVSVVIPKNFIVGTKGSVCDGYMARSSSSGSGHGVLERVTERLYRNVLLSSLGRQCDPVTAAPRLVVVNRAGGHNFDDDVLVLKTAVKLGGGDGRYGFAVSRDKFRDHWRKRSHEFGFHGPKASSKAKVCDPTRTVRYEQQCNLDRLVARTMQAWLACHRLSYSFTVSIVQGQITEMCPAERWRLCRKLMEGLRSDDSAPPRVRPHLRASHAGVTALVRFNLRIDDKQKKCMSALGLPECW